jgi:hypothetical protein
MELRVFILGLFTFRPESVVALKRVVWFPFLAQGVRGQHCVQSYPERIIFWSRGNPDTLLTRIRDSGFEPMASLADMPTRRGLAFRWQTIIVAFIVWNGLSYSACTMRR